MAGADDDFEGLWAKYFDAREDVTLPSGDENYTVHAFDFRGHGKTQTSRDDDLSMETLVHDTLDVLSRVIPPLPSPADPKTDADAALENPQTVIVGHSLGGAVAVRVAATGQATSLVGVMVIDVVEGTALASLKHMGVILDKRPSRFRSYKDAIHWGLHSGTVRNPDAADVSIPSQLMPLEDGSLVWRTDLASSAKYWRGASRVRCCVRAAAGPDWFIGLSEQFLALKEAKILVLAGDTPWFGLDDNSSDRLDTALVRGQMMGKFELRLMYGSGHVIQEDCPDQVASAIMEFCGRCARASSGDIFGLNGASRQPTKDLILAERLAKARAMIPKEGEHQG
ncbi:hypothetical protein BBJ28_00017793 [Nothophytophthora sp. Chile5]|nr:hypothetical protein BBJ28_00017793 [Nothophytophthora sp. Chile5]